MAGGQERQLRRRIKSVQSTKKITRAMELIAASQMGRARARLVGTRPYVDAIEKVLSITASEATRASRIVGVPERAAHVLQVSIVGDRGLSGAYNSSVLRTAERAIRAGQAEGANYRLVTVGRKAVSFFRRRDLAIEHSFVAMSDRPTFDDARAVAAEVTFPFLAGEVDLVELVSTRMDGGNQNVERRQILPLVVASPSDNDGGAPAASSADGFYDFEPSPEELLELLVPQYVEVFLFRALLEASAAEHTSRRRAMAAATENAEELITTYSRAMNRARQDSITTEIMEIVSGAEALRTTGKPRREDMSSEDNEEQIA